MRERESEKRVLMRKRMQETCHVKFMPTFAFFFLFFFLSQHVASLELKNATYRTPAINLGPGEVSNKVYMGIPSPKGHYALKRFDAEVVDEEGVPIPLTEVYLHHWVTAKIYTKIGEPLTDSNSTIFPWIDGFCNESLPHFWGSGSETRHTRSSIPDPYGIEFGNPNSIPAGYEENWMMNVHAIDNRGTIDPIGCLECRCPLYNISGPPGYLGGMQCCPDGSFCPLINSSFHDYNYNASRRPVFLQYSLEWVEWSSDIIPLKVYLLDVSDQGHGCQVEYDVPATCTPQEPFVDCLSTLQSNAVMPFGGKVVYGVAHQHVGGVITSLYGEDGKDICTSVPLYGSGQSVGDEFGYVVGMSTCYPTNTTLKAGEKLTLKVTYNGISMHSGVMGIFLLLVA